MTGNGLSQNQRRNQLRDLAKRERALRKRLPMRIPLPIEFPEGTDPIASEFINWLMLSLSDGELPYNRTGGLVHFVAEGMLLVSPAIFKHYAPTLASDIGTDGREAWQVVQQKFSQANFILRDHGDRIYRYAFVMKTRHGTARDTGNRVKGMILPSVGQWFTQLPPLNHRLVRIRKEAYQEPSTEAA